MPETEIKMTPFKACPHIYQLIYKLYEECGEVSKAFYNIELKSSSELTTEDVDKLVEESADVMQVAFNIISWFNYDVQEVIDKVTEKNMARGYYDAK